MSRARPTNMVDEAFWEDDYFADVVLPARPDERVPFERCLAATLAKHASVHSGATVFEVGCAPARWLLFYAERFGAIVEGVEQSEKGAALSRENLRCAGVEGVVHDGDFFSIPAKAFELVLSLGFIEHFDDLDSAFSRHLEFLTPTGRLVIGVPNFKGLNRLLQGWSNPAHLELHNLEAMRPSLYRRLAQENGLEIEFLGHVGGIDPVIIKVGRRSALPLIKALGRYRTLPLAERLNHRWLSSYLLLVLRRSAVPGPRVTLGPARTA